MGRSREFDINEALRIAADLFWRKGYDGASVSDMTAAMGINPPSFYAAFGNKEDLFRRIVEHYRERQAPVVEASLSQPTVGRVVESLLYGYADLLTERGRAPGCLIMSSSLPVSDDHPFRREFAAERKELKDALRKRFARLVREGGDQTRAIDPPALAQLVVAVVWGMAVEAQSGANRAALRAAVAAFCAGCCPRAPSV